MQLDFELCDKARLSRDPRFDGRFFVAVSSTGIYCRPICPAPAAQSRNVLFFHCAAAAREAGFRPCRRCRPEAAPGTPAWVGTSSTVSRALRLIAEGYLDDHGVEDLAGLLGIGDRHLRRLFLEHVGATPKMIAATRRLHFAARLIEETRLPMTAVASGSGFKSLRRFNAAIHETYGRSPSSLRSEGQNDMRSVGGNSDLALRLAYRPPFQWQALLDFLARRAVPGVEEVRNGVYRRTIVLDGARGIIEVAHEERRRSLLVRIRVSNPRALLTIADRVRNMFDLSSDPLEVSTALRRDPVLGGIVRRHPGLRVPGAWDSFELAVRAILGRQVSVKAAATRAGRMASRFGTPLEEVDGTLSVLFPDAGSLCGADLTEIGLTRNREATIRNLAASIANGRRRIDGAVPLTATIRKLCDIPGIGEWTAQYIAMRALREPDAFPIGDLGITRGLARIAGGMHPIDSEHRAAVWRPWRAYAAMYLWTYA